MKNLDKVEKFYDSLKDISIVNNDLQDKRELLKKYVYAYNKNIQIIQIDKTLQKQNKEMGELLNSTLHILQNSSKKWVENFDNILEKEKFRSDLENYFIIIIFGKVNAGKSSLGNFIAQNRPKNEKVGFFKYDKAGQEQTIQKLEEIDDDSFDTNNLECTIKIQGFKLNSMAWIDTPGLGSMVEENGELAKAYIQSADYIICPLSSDAPEEKDGIEEIEKLLIQNKKATICITKSDKFEKRKDSNGKYIKQKGKIAKFLVNKSKENRLEQEESLKKAIFKISKNESLLGDIISISAHTAKQGLKNKDKELFENSNILKFYELITEVVKEKASKLKSETPFNGLKSFIDNDVLGLTDKPNPLTVKIIREKIDELDNSINETLNRFNTLIENIKSDISREVEAIVSQYYMKIDRYNSEEIFKNIDKDIADKISEIIENNIRDAFENFSYSLDNLATSISGDNFKIDDIYEEYTYTTEERNKNIGSALLGLGATIGAGLLTGGGAWVVAGASILAGGAGGYVGGKLGGMTGSKHTSIVNIGDNKEEVIQKFKEMQIENHENNTKEVYTKIQNSFFIPLQDMITNMRLELDRFEKNINTLKKELS
ncbi:MAG: 50S ribosome-binding GTPase [Sulfurovum sp.]